MCDDKSNTLKLILKLCAFSKLINNKRILLKYISKNAIINSVFINITYSKEKNMRGRWTRLVAILGATAMVVSQNGSLLVIADELPADNATVISEEEQ